MEKKVERVIGDLDLNIENWIHFYFHITRLKLFHCEKALLKGNIPHLVSPHRDNVPNEMTEFTMEFWIWFLQISQYDVVLGKTNDSWSTGFGIDCCEEGDDAVGIRLFLNRWPGNFQMPPVIPVRT